MAPTDVGLPATDLVGCVVLDLDGTLTLPGSTRVVPGILPVLAELARRGVELAVATSAPLPVARRVLAETALEEWFASVAGSAPNAAPGGKDAIVAEALLGLGRPLPDGARGAAVVGDGAGDMAAGVRHGLVSIGVSWGRTPVDRLREAGAAVVVDAPSELLDLVGVPRVGEGDRSAGLLSDGALRSEHDGRPGVGEGDRSAGLLSDGALRSEQDGPQGDHRR